MSTATSQHMQALDRANAIRLPRAAEHRRIKVMVRAGGLLAILAVLDDIADGQPCPDMLSTLSLVRWLTWVKLVGAPRAHQYLARAAGAPRVRDPDTTVGELTPREATILGHVIYAAITEAR